MATLSASSLAPPPKKPRTESGDGDKDVLIEEEDEVISDDTNSLPDDVVDEYMRQVAESDGFEVDDFFEYSLFGAIRPCQMSDRLIKLVNPLTELAIKHFNKEKGANIQFVKLLKVTAGGGCGITFYITFEAMDAADSQIKTFQAKVLYGINDEVEFCRLKPQSIKQGFEVKSGVDGIPTGLSVNRGIIIAVVLAAAAFIMLSLFATYACYARLKIKQERSNLGLVSTSINKYSSLNFKYETLEKATDYFNSSRKIGQGGGGSVYKGTLPNGKTVAVKRLFYSTRQWVDEFFNEVNLISGIQHKHLVKLLGCIIEGPESLLVYEYLPNRTLDQFLFDKNKVQILNWPQRFNIIVGTAEGLAYLHESSNIRIIHRDIKSSNVLLDENLSPKIADCGLARCFAADKSHLSTGIAGTLGYMAPEYLVQGQLTEKADFYSFGVLVLEIVTGRRNRNFKQESDSRSLLHQVWKLYRSNELAEAVDPCLGDDFPAKQASNVLQIGLLCTQSSVALRPSMAQVIVMLTNKDGEVVPIPNQPPFLNAMALEPASCSTIRSYSANSFASNALTEASTYTSTESSTTPLSSDGDHHGPSRNQNFLHN